MNSPSYLTIEGVDSVGKTSLAFALHKYYEAQGVRSVVKPEIPAAPEIAARIGEALKQSIFIGDAFIGGPAAAFFYMAYAEMTALSELPASDLIIGDRGLDSLCLYEGALVCSRERFDGMAAVAAMEALYQSLGLRVPERTLLLILPSADLPDRFVRRNGRAPTADELAHLVWLQDEFVRVAAMRPRFNLLDARDEPGTVLSNAVRAIESDLRADHP